MKKSVLALLLVFALALSLTACKGSTPSGNSSPTGDASVTPGTSDTSIPAGTQSGNASGTPSAAASGTSSAAPTPPKVAGYDSAKKAEVDNTITNYNDWYGIDYEALVSDAFATYGEYINPNINKEAVLTAIASVKRTAGTTEYSVDLPEASVTKVNDFLVSKGKDKLDPNGLTRTPYKYKEGYKQSVAAFVLAASLYYEPNYDNVNSTSLDLLLAFNRAFSGTNEIDKTNEPFATNFHCLYYVQYEGQ